MDRYLAGFKKLIYEEELRVLGEIKEVIANGGNVEGKVKEIERRILRLMED